MALVLLRGWTKHPQQLPDGIVELIDDALLEGNDRVVGDRDVFRTDLRAAFRDIAVADALGVLEIGGAALDIERMHLERRGVDEEPGTDERLVELVFAQDMAHVLAEKALDA